MICKYTNTHKVTKLEDTESLLHKQLKERFPNDTIDGDNIHYVNVIEDEDFLEFFGNWTDPNIYLELIDKAENTLVFNEQGEPNLLEDAIGSYFLNIKGQKEYINDNFVRLTSEQIIDIVNSITGEYIINPGESIFDFLKSKLSSRIFDITKFISNEEKSILKDTSLSNLDKLRKENQLDSFRNIKDKLVNIINDYSALRNLERKIINKLEKYNFKYTETISDKEDKDTHEDITNYILESNETSNRAINDTEVLVFLSSVPKFKNYNKDILLQKEEINPLLLTKSYMEQSHVWGMLENIFADIIPNLYNKEYESKDVFDNYVQALEYAVEYSEHPELNYILDYFKNLTDENLKTKLVTTFFKSSQKYLINQVDVDKDNNISFKIIDPNIKTNKKGKLTNNYIETIINLEDSNIDKIILDAKFEFNNIKKLNDIKEYIKFLNNLLINNLNLPLSSRTIEFFVKSNTNSDFNILINKINKFLSTPILNSKITNIVGKEINGELSVLNKLNSVKDNKDARIVKDYLMENHTFLKQLSDSDSLFKNEVSESTVIVGGKQRWSYSYMSGLNLEILKWKAGNIESLKNLENRGIGIVDYLLEDTSRIQNIDLYTNSEIKKENDNNPTLHKRITEVDLHLDIFSKMFNSRDTFNTELKSKRKGKEAQELDLKNYMTYNFGADKNSLFALFGLPRPTAGMTNLFKDKKIGIDLKRKLSNYVKGELKQAQQEALKVQHYFNLEEDKKLDYLMKNLIPDFHYKKSNIESDPLTLEDVKKGNFYKIGIFSSSLDKYIEDNEELVYDTSFVPIVRESFLNSDNFSSLMSIVNQDIEDIINKEYEYLTSISLVDKLDNKGKPVYKSLFDINTNIEFENKDQKIYSYIISSFLNSYELSNIFNGHIAYYKQKGAISLDDFLKRAPAVATDGLYLRHRNTGIAKTYKDYNNKDITIADKDNKTVVAIVDNIDIDVSKYADIISIGRERNKINFNHEIADAQGYITEDHFKDIIERIYGWSEYDQTMFDELSNPNHKHSDENIRWIKRFSKAMTPLKMVYFGINEQGVPIYLKYSVAPLFKAITANSDMDNILDRMKYQGVEQVVFKSGSKASNYPSTTIHNINDKGEFDGLVEDIKFNPFVIDSSKLKMQVQLPTKLDKSIVLGNQSIKNILTNIDITSDNKEYTWNDNSYTGKEIYDLVNSTAVNILQTQLNNLLLNLGYKDGKFDNKSIKRLLMNQMDLETEADIKNLLKTDLPLETIPNFAQRAFPVISSFIHKNAGKIYTNGSSVVQVANIGFDRITQKSAEGVFFFNKDTELTPPIPVTDKDNNPIYYDETGKITTKDKGKLKIKKAKILLPFSSIFHKSGLSYNEFKELYKSGKIDKEIFSNVLGYRIPNQAISSNDSFEIIGILPPIAGDQGIVYHEITAKTGSDFDIDKMYLMLPNFKVNKEYYIPEENQVKLGKDVPYLSDMLKYEGLSKGNDFLNLLSKNEAVFTYMYNKLGKPSLKGKKLFIKNPIKFILDNSEDILDILQESNSIEDDIDLFDFMQELVSAQSRQQDIIKDKNKEVFRKYAKVESIRSIRYKKDNSYKGNQNKIIELLNSILEAPITYNDLMSPLDNDIVKQTINDIKYKKALAKEEIENNITKEEYLKKLEVSALEEMFPVSLVKSRVDVLEAKTLIAIMANNMTDLSESQKVNFKISTPIGIKNKDKDALELDRVYMLGQDNNSDQKISKIVSYFMNAAVDAAKDNYIIEGNFNTYTANAGMLLLRLGTNLDDIFTILMNDTIMDYSKRKNYAKAKLSDVVFETEEDLTELSKSFLIELQSNNNDLFKVISREDFLSNNVDKKDLILGYWNVLQQLGKEFNESVVTTKADANGTGSNIADYVVLNNRIERVNNGTIKNTFNKWFTDGYSEFNFTFNPNIKNNPNVKFLGAMANNTLFLMNELSKDLFIETTPEVRNTVNDILNALGDPISNDPTKVKLIYNYLYSNILYNTGHKIYNIDEAQEKYLLKKFPSDLQIKKGKKNNMFLNELFVSSIEDENLIRFPNYKNYTSQDKVKLKESFLDLLNGDKAFVDNLVQYAFLTTGFKSTYYSFNDIIPATYFVDNFHGKSIQDFINKNIKIDFEKVITAIAKTNPRNYKLIKKLGRNETIMFGNIKEKTLKKITNKDGSFKPFVFKNQNLYMLTNLNAFNKPEYKLISILDTSNFKKFSFNNIEEGLIPQEHVYISNIKDIYDEFIAPEEEIEQEEQIIEIENNLVSLPKPILDINYLPDSELIKLDDAITTRRKQEEIKEKFKDLQDLINCIWE